MGGSFKYAFHVFPSFGLAQVCLCRVIHFADEHIVDDGDVCDFAYPLSQQGALVVSALVLSFFAQWHGHNAINSLKKVEAVLHVYGHQATHVDGKFLVSVVFDVVKNGMQFACGGIEEITRGTLYGDCAIKALLQSVTRNAMIMGVR